MVSKILPNAAQLLIKILQNFNFKQVELNMSSSFAKRALDRSSLANSETFKIVGNAIAPSYTVVEAKGSGLPTGDRAHPSRKVRY